MTTNAQTWNSEYYAKNARFGGRLGAGFDVSYINECSRLPS